MASPADKGDLSLTLYLLNIEENGEARRTDMKAAGQGLLQYPPLAVNLHYLLTAYSNADVQSRTLDEHRIMGKVLQIVHDHAAVKEPYLQGSLAETGEALRMSIESMDSDTLIGIWSFGDAPYRMSLVLKVGPIYVDSTRTKQASRVIERQLHLKDRSSRQED